MKIRYYAFFAMAIGAQTAQADIAFNNFGPGDTFNTGTGWTASGSASSPGPFETACQFTSLTSGTLLSVTVAASFVSGTNSVNVSLYNDAADTVGSMITNWSFGGLPAFGSGFTPQTLINGFPTITLSAGTKYWVSVRPGASDTWDVWNWNSTADSGLKGLSTDGGATYGYATSTRGALRVETTVVPEPATLAAIGLGFAALIRRRRN